MFKSRFQTKNSTYHFHDLISMKTQAIILTFIWHQTGSESYKNSTQTNPNTLFLSFYCFQPIGLHFEQLIDS